MLSDSFSAAWALVQTGHTLAYKRNRKEICLDDICVLVVKTMYIPRLEYKVKCPLISHILMNMDTVRTLLVPVKYCTLKNMSNGAARSNSDRPYSCNEKKPLLNVCTFCGIFSNHSLPPLSWCVYQNIDISHNFIFFIYENIRTEIWYIWLQVDIAWVSFINQHLHIWWHGKCNHIPINWNMWLPRRAVSSMAIQLDHHFCLGTSKWSLWIRLTFMTRYQKTPLKICKSKMGNELRLLQSGMVLGSERSFAYRI